MVLDERATNDHFSREADRDHHQGRLRADPARGEGSSRIPPEEEPHEAVALLLRLVRLGDRLRPSDRVSQSRHLFAQRSQLLGSMVPIVSGVAAPRRSRYLRKAEDQRLRSLGSWSMAARSAARTLPGLAAGEVGGRRSTSDHAATATPGAETGTWSGNEEGGIRQAGIGLGEGDGAHRPAGYHLLHFLPPRLTTGPG